METVAKIREELNANILLGISTGDISLVETSVEKYKQCSGKTYELNENPSDDALYAESVFFDRDEPFYLGIEYLIQHYLEKNNSKVYQFCDYCVDFFYKANRSDCESNYGFLLLSGLPSQKAKEIVIYCFHVKAQLLWELGKQQEAIDVAEFGAIFLKSSVCTYEAAIFYSSFNDEQSLSKACCYLEMYDWNDENAYANAREARRKLIACRAMEVEATMRSFAEDWLIPPSDNSITWEEYSNIRGDANQIKRKKLTATEYMLSVGEDFNGVPFECIKYQPGQIDLMQLWNYYKDCHSQVSTKLLILKKKNYVGNLYEGDFIDCVKWLWEQKYRSQVTAPHTTLFDDSKEIPLPQNIPLQEQAVGESEPELTLGFSDLLNSLEIGTDVQETREMVDLSGLEEKKVGKIAQEDLRHCLESGILWDDELLDLQQKEYCKTTFNLNFPLLVKSDGEYDSTRYYSKSILIRGVEYKLCSQWYESNRSYLINWIRMHS